jgi:hypothetical protein
MVTLQLEDLSNELIVKVFSYLEIKELIRCGQLSKRIRIISHDQSLWQKMNLSSDPWEKCTNKVPAEFLHMVIRNGCKYLSLNSGQIQSDLKLNRVSSLVYLKLVTIIPVLPSDVHFNDILSEELLETGHSLKKLSVEGYISPGMAKHIGFQNGKILKVLDLRSCTLINHKSMKISQYTSDSERKKELNSIELIVKNCTNLKEFHLNGTNISAIAINFLVHNITPTVEILSFNYMKLISDKHVKILGSRCPKLKTLILAGTSITSESINIIIETMKTTLEYLDVAFALNFDIMKILELRTMPKLKTLIGTGLAPVKEQLEGYFPNLVIYEFDNVHEHCEFTRSSAGNLSESDGIWEIKAKQLKLFKKSNAFNNGIL